MIHNNYDPLTIDMSAYPAVINMHRNGMMIDVEYFHDLSTDFENQIALVQEHINDLAGERLNPKSQGAVGQVSRVLQKLGIYPYPQLVDAETLSRYRHHQIVDEIFNYRELFDIKTKFIDILPRYVDQYSRIHPHIKTTRTATGRYSVANPNLQQIPTRTENGRKIRRGFIAPAGCVLIGLDFSQIELRLAAHISQDISMLNVYKNGLDIHENTAKSLLRLLNLPVNSDNLKKYRRPAKNINFGILYGITAEGLYDGFITQGVTEYSERDCEKFIQAWYNEYNGVKQWEKDIHSFIRRNGYSETMFGRRRLIPEVNSVHSWIRSAGIRQGGNAIIQGSAADLMKISMKKVYDAICNSLHVKMIMTVHDELLFEVDADHWIDISNQIKHIMENAVTISVPIECDVEFGVNWADMVETN